MFFLTDVESHKKQMYVIDLLSLLILFQLLLLAKAHMYYVTWSDKMGTFPISKHRETNDWSYTYQIFTHSILIPYLQNHPLYKDQATKVPSILDSFYPVSGEFQHLCVAGAWGRQDGGFKFLKTKRRDVLGQVMGHTSI